MFHVILTKSQKLILTFSSKKLSNFKKIRVQMWINYFYKWEEAKQIDL